MVILIQLLDAAPLPVLLLAIICVTVVIVVALVLCAFFPEMGATIADILYAWRAPGCHLQRTRQQSRGRRGKRGKGR